MDYDVIVIGSGFMELTAASLLHATRQEAGSGPGQHFRLAVSTMRSSAKGYHWDVGLLRR